MKVKVLEKKDGGKKGKFLLEGSYYSFANALRRTILLDIPAMAVDRVTIYENTGFLYDEMVSKRLGLMPLTTDLKTYSPKDECKCGGKGCARCEVALILEKEGPCVVYMKDIKSRDPKIQPIYGDMPLLKLAQGQKVKIEMVASLGTPKQHAKFQTALAAYDQKSDTSFEFVVESYDDQPFDTKVKQAIDILDSKFNDFKAALSDSKKKPTKAAAKTKPKKKEAKKKAE